MFKIEKEGAFSETTVKNLLNILSDVDFEPPYQRYGYVWPLDKRKLLLDSIINGYDIPKFYLHYITDFNNELNHSGKSYAIIDGKQRLQTLDDFLHNRLSLSTDFVYEKNKEIDLSNLTYREIGIKYPEIKFDIDSFKLDFVFIITDELEKIEELFFRLNEGKPLNNAEKRNRYVGFLNQSIKRIISGNDFFTKKFVYSNSRLQYEDLCLKMIFIEYNNKLITFSKNGLDKFVEENRVSSEQLQDAINKVEENINKMSEIFEDNDILLKSRSAIPVYYYFISRCNPSVSKVRDFLEKFNEIRRLNRSESDSNPILSEYDRQSQQGTHTESSLIFRQTILEKFYLKYSDSNMKWNTRVPLDDLHMDIEIDAE